MYCPECGTKIFHENARFCPECGQRLFVVSVENETKNTTARTTDSNQTDVAGNVKTSGGDFVGRDFHEGKSFVFHLAQPGVYKVILSATLSVLFIFLLARTLILVYRINIAPQPGTITVHPGVIITATAAARAQVTAETERATAAAVSAHDLTAQVTQAARATRVQATIAIELTLGAEARATLAVLQAPTGTPAPSSLPTAEPTPATTLLTDIPQPPTATPTTILPTQTPTAAITATPSASFALSAADCTNIPGADEFQVSLISPPNDSTGSGPQTFSWNGPELPTLGNGLICAYELFFYQAGQDPMQQGIGWAGLSFKPSVHFRLDSTLTQPPITGTTYLWGVRLVVAGKNYRILKLLSVGQERKFRYEAIK